MEAASRILDRVANYDEISSRSLKEIIMKALPGPRFQTCFLTAWISFMWPVLGFCLVHSVFLLTMPLILITKLYRTLLGSYILRNGHEERMLVTPDDAIWFQTTKENVPIINMLMLVDGRMELAKLRKLMLNRVVMMKDENDNLLHPKFSFICTKVMRQRVWLKDAWFDIKRHVKLMDCEVPESEDKLRLLLGRLCSWPLPSDQSPWELIIIPIIYAEEDMCYLLFRVHRSLGDGFSILNIFNNHIVDVTPTKTSQIKHSNYTKSFVYSIKAAVIGPARFAEQIILPLDYHIFHGPNLSGDKLVVISEPVDLKMVRRMAEAARCSIANVLMACLAAGLSEYLQRHASRVPESMVALVPVDVGHDGEGSNSGRSQPMSQSSFTYLELPLREDGLIEYLQETTRRMETSRYSPLVSFNWVSSLFLSLLPLPASTRLLNQMYDRSSLLLSHIQGPNIKLHVASHPIHDIIFLPPQRSSVGLAVSLFSYNGHVTLGLTIDKMLCTNPPIIADLFEYKLYEMAAMLNAFR